MGDFKKVTLEDREIFAKYLSMNEHRACDYSAANLILWSAVYNTEYLIEQNMLFIKYLKNGDWFFSYPIGNGDLKKSFEMLLEYCKEQKMEFKMNIIEPHMYEEIEKIFPGKYGINYIRDNADYVYKTDDLKNLSGKKYHGKKNHINKFLKTYKDWTYETITEKNTDESIEMVREWCMENGCCDDKSKADEICVLINGLRHRKELNMVGGVIRIKNRIAALTLVEKSGDDMFIIHFEKALADFEGAYQMINQQFIIHELSEYTYVNREEDLGIEGLRRAKESYHPAFMVEKGVLVAKD
jgi:hypothetical protein